MRTSLVRPWLTQAVRQTTSQDCLLWPFARTRQGYGVASGYGCATHLALELDGRPRPGMLIALHACDNPPCVNPQHLRWGTRADNADDCGRRDRRAVGLLNGRVKLTDEQVRDIATRAVAGESTRSLAEQFGVTAQHVRYIRNGKRRQRAVSA